MSELRVTPDRWVTARYAGASGDFNPIHLDDEFARSVGLPGKVLHGLWTMAQVARAVTVETGPGSLARLAVTFRGVGLPEHELTVTTELREAREDGVRVIAAEVRQDGKRIVRDAEAELRP